jgi:hypothetical protein
MGEVIFSTQKVRSQIYEMLEAAGRAATFATTKPDTAWVFWGKTAKWENWAAKKAGRHRPCRFHPGRNSPMTGFG